MMRRGVREMVQVRLGADSDAAPRAADDRRILGVTWCTGTSGGTVAWRCDVGRGSFRWRCGAEHDAAGEDGADSSLVKVLRNILLVRIDDDGGRLWLIDEDR